VPRRQASQVELPLGLQAYRNTALFSDHFLAERLPNMHWFARRRTAARTAYDEVRAIFEAVDPETALVSAPEAQCEEDIIKPVLTALGHSYLVQTATSAGGWKNFPDYALFRDEQDKNAARAEVATNDYGRAMGVAEGKYWDRDLDRLVRSSRDYLTNQNPSFQIINYLTMTGKRWGILTNGRRWRLYCRDVPQPLERFYEVDLLRLVRESGAEAFLHYFFGFFSKDALRPGADGDAHVDNVRVGSANFSEGVGDELRARVFSALTRLAAGFLRVRQEPISQDELDTVYDNALVVLYRMLFVLYAEARELLPLETSDSYREQLSLYRLVRDVADARERRRMFSDTSTLIWARLRALWTAIDEGDAALRVPAYDGELFASDAHPYLNDHVIADLFLADAIDLIGRVPTDTEARFVDYRSLSVTHLGTVYEGLLEQTLAIAEGRLGGIEDRVVLAPVRRRRRETGSYYTPDAIVRHIVSETLEPLIAGKTDAEILQLRICDPAMGSGHFLVAVVERLALAIATSPTSQDPYDDDDDLSSIKRRIVENCIYGVDINPLAVELAKLALWLATASADKPLTFLDHRLRVGNSVLTLGAGDVTKALRRGRRRASEQVSAFEAAFAAQHARDLQFAEKIEATPTDTLAGIEQRKSLYRDQKRSRDRLRHIYGAATAVMFDLIDVETLEALIAALDAEDAEWSAALSAATSEDPPSGHDFRPFHWELEFPEVFDNGGGFDAVVGNPPYVNAWEMETAAPGLREGLRALPGWNAVAKRHWDLFVLFVALGQQLLVPNGMLGIIVANPLMREKYAAALRGSLLQGTLLSFVDFGSTNVFEGVARETVVMVWRNAPPADDHEVVLYDADSVLDET
jgi:hypothetical protein